VDAIAVVQQSVPRELARVLDHDIGCADVEPDDSLEPRSQKSVQLAYVTHTVALGVDHVESN
jgi:hypothetical protein